MYDSFYIAIYNNIYISSTIIVFVFGVIPRYSSVIASYLEASRFTTLQLIQNPTREENLGKSEREWYVLLPWLGWVQITNVLTYSKIRPIPIP